MAKNEQDDLGNEGRAYAKFTGLAFQMIAIIGLMAYAGYKIDQSAGHQTKWVTAAMSLAGVFISMYLVIRAVKN
ncbi:AtpZ/AtpI family protein [Mucilaginibacter mali]|uniref:AtpZ/AtpI family protein n=1 Tax=Mucilaginibacter mali TaxID=2740462 RepID=A0A7D4QL39_9SPHI|nr:AtpZ/AtpI family protein [Mucilaginibacter mali]QKJ30970.1 AtpZ/AtpI family protein [Mucilaginibacter mali]